MAARFKCRQKIQYPGPVEFVQPLGGLVQHQQQGRLDQCPGDQHQPLLPVTHLVEGVRIPAPEAGCREPLAGNPRLYFVDGVIDPDGIKKSGADHGQCVTAHPVEPVQLAADNAHLLF